MLHIEYLSTKPCTYTYYPHYRLLHSNKLASTPLKEARIKIVEIHFLSCAEGLQMKMNTHVLHIEYPTTKLCMYTYYQHYKLLHLNKLASRPLKEARIRIVGIIFLCCDDHLQMRMNIQRTCRACCTTPIGCTAASIGSSTRTTIGACWRANG